MNKPFTLQVGDFRKELIDLLNSSQLPAYVLKKELEFVYQQIEELEKNEINDYNNNNNKEEEKRK